MQYAYTDNFLKNSKYKAHTCDGYKEKETLKEHLDNVLKVSFSLIDKYDLEKILDNIILNINDDWQKEIKDLFLSVIYFHDYGKINPIYQKIKMNEEKFSEEILKLPENLRKDVYSGHSIISVIVYIDTFINKYYNIIENNEDFLYLIGKFSINILKHHSSYIDIYDKNKINEPIFLDYIEILKKTGYKFNLAEMGYSSNVEILNVIKTSLEFTKKEKDEYLYYLLRLNFGILTKSDYIATSNYMNGYKHTENIIDKKDIINKFWEEEKFKNGEINFNSKINLTSLKDISKKRNMKNLNNIRCHMLKESIDNFKNNKDKNVFFLECPTGGGKTNISFALLDEIIKNFDIKKCFYVFPFNKLSDQTYTSLVNTFHLDENKVASLSYDSFKEVDDDKEESVFKRDTKNMMNNIFMNFSFLLMSHVRFFDILKGNSKKTMYNLHTISNSVVILDEIQAYNPKHWSKIIYFINNYSKMFNIKFIIMSATLPKLDKLLGIDEKIINLISDRNKYFLNENFKDRVEFNGDYLKEEMTFDILKNLIIEKSENYYKNNKTSHTIVEFLYKSRASEFVSEYRDEFESKGYKVMLLSSTTLKPKSFRIIKDIKEKIYDKIILICTQTVEAGVDIDMDTGFKDVSIIDSEEQLAGRINRNANKTDNKLYLINFGNKFIYQEDWRYKTAIPYNSEYIKILNNKDFKIVYNIVLKKLKDNDITNNTLSLKVYKDYIIDLNLEEVNKNLMLIEDSGLNLNLFIPINIPIEDIKLIFCDITFLNKYIKDGYLIGEKVWEEYTSILNNKQFFKLRKFQKIFSLFTTNVFLSKDVKENIYNYIEDSDNIVNKVIDNSIYSYEDGFDIKKITGDKKFEFID